MTRKKETKPTGPVPILEDDDLAEYWVQNELQKGNPDRALQAIEICMKETQRRGALLTWKRLRSRS